MDDVAASLREHAGISLEENKPALGAAFKSGADEIDRLNGVITRLQAAMNGIASALGAAESKDTCPADICQVQHDSLGSNCMAEIFHYCCPSCGAIASIHVVKAVAWEEMAERSREIDRLRDLLLAIYQAPDVVIPTAFRSVAYDGLFNVITRDVADYQLVARSDGSDSAPPGEEP